MPLSEVATTADLAWMSLALAAAGVAIGAGVMAAIARKTRVAWVFAGATTLALVVAPIFAWLTARERAESLGGGASMMWWFSFPAVRAYAVLAVALAAVAVGALFEKK